MNVEFDGFIGPFEDFFDENGLTNLLNIISTYNDLGAF